MTRYKRRPLQQDVIDGAIAAADQPQAADGSANGSPPPMEPGTVATLDITLPTGRAAKIIVPLPIHPMDIGAITAMLAQVFHETQSAATPEQIRNAAARSRLVLPQ